MAGFPVAGGAYLLDLPALIYPDNSSVALY